MMITDLHWRQASPPLSPVFYCFRPFAVSISVNPTGTRSNLWNPGHIYLPDAIRACAYMKERHCYVEDRLNVRVVASSSSTSFGEDWLRNPAPVVDSASSLMVLRNVAAMPKMESGLCLQGEDDWVPGEGGGVRTYALKAAEARDKSLCESLNVHPTPFPHNQIRSMRRMSWRDAKRFKNNNLQLRTWKPVNLKNILLVSREWGK